MGQGDDCAQEVDCDHATGNAEHYEGRCTRQLGGLEALKLQTLPVPKVGPGEVLVRVENQRG